MVYSIVMLLTGVLFVTNIEFRKPGIKLVMLMVLAGFVEIVLITLVKMGVITG